MVGTNNKRAWKSLLHLFVCLFSLSSQWTKRPVSGDCDGRRSRHLSLSSASVQLRWSCECTERRRWTAHRSPQRRSRSLTHSFGCSFHRNCLTRFATSPRTLHRERRQLRTISRAIIVHRARSLTRPSLTRSRNQHAQRLHMNDENCKAEASSAGAASAAAASAASIAAAVSSNAVAAPSGASAPPPPPSLLHSVASYPTVSFHSLQRAQKTIADFMQSYLFIFHAQPDRCDSGRTGGSGATDSAVAGAAATSAAHCSSQSADLGLPSPTGVPSAATLQLMFRLLPLLTFVSATIYQLDEENEEHNQRQRCKREQEREEGANAKRIGAEADAATPSTSRNAGKGTQT